eukprot:1158233-Pelagomonas_calceolata.AAC.15
MTHCHLHFLPCMRLACQPKDKMEGARALHPPGQWRKAECYAHKRPIGGWRRKRRTSCTGSPAGVQTRGPVESREGKEQILPCTWASYREKEGVRKKLMEKEREPGWGANTGACGGAGKTQRNTFAMCISLAAREEEGKNRGDKKGEGACGEQGGHEAAQMKKSSTV